MNIKQLESAGGIALGIFGTAFVGAVVATVQAGQIPATWPEVRHVLAGAALAGAMAVFGWIKLKSPWAVPATGAVGSQNASPEAK